MAKAIKALGLGRVTQNWGQAGDCDEPLKILAAYFKKIKTIEGKIEETRLKETEHNCEDIKNITVEVVLRGCDFSRTIVGIKDAKVENSFTTYLGLYKLGDDGVSSIYRGLVLLECEEKEFIITLFDNETKIDEKKIAFKPIQINDRVVENNVTKTSTCGIEYKDKIKCTRRFVGKTKEERKDPKNYVYGPLIEGEMKMKDFKNFNNLIEKGILNENEKKIILAMSENEGNLDAVQSYDREVVSIGAMQKTMNINGTGELPIQIFDFKTSYPNLYKTLLENCGWKVEEEFEKNEKGKIISTKYVMYYNNTLGKELKNLIRKGFNSDNFGNIVRCIPLEPIVKLVKDVNFQELQLKDFIKRLEMSLLKIPTNYSYKINQYIKSNLGKATVLDHDVNRPGHVEKCFSKALDELFRSNKNIPKNPKEWGGNHSNYEKKLLEIYGPLRGKGDFSMTDATVRYNNLKNKL